MFSTLSRHIRCFIPSFCRIRQNITGILACRIRFDQNSLLYKINQDLKGKMQLFASFSEANNADIRVTSVLKTGETLILRHLSGQDHNKATIALYAPEITYADCIPPEHLSFYGMVQKRHQFPSSTNSYCHPKCDNPHLLLLPLLILSPFS